MSRYRSCSCPEPKAGGATCSGEEEIHNGVGVQIQRQPCPVITFCPGETASLSVLLQFGIFISFVCDLLLILAFNYPPTPSSWFLESLVGVVGLRRLRRLVHSHQGVQQSSHQVWRSPLPRGEQAETQLP